MQLTEFESHSFVDAFPLKPFKANKKTLSSKTAISIEDFIISKTSEEGYCFITKQVKLEDNVFLAFTNAPFNIDLLNRIQYKHIVNLKRLNDTRYLNDFFRSTNAKLPLGGLYINFAETFASRKQRILKALPNPLNWIHYFIDTSWTRVASKLKLTKDIYFSLTNGKDRSLSRTEILGRLYYCGFEVLEEKQIDGYLYFIARKIKDPVEEKTPYYGTLIRLKRVGKDGNLINVYKLRTMHAYSEYLQKYVFEKNQLQAGGKFKNDFRISPEGKFFRKFWLDELPMLINFLKGEMKLVGIRPLSEHYFNLYSKELQEKRIKCKPGLIPPFYADLPETLEEIQASEMRYLDAYINNPIKTDISYFFKALKNILFKGARSK